MGDRSAIGWTDATWNPTVGCSLESPGCAGCYAMREAARLARMGVARYAGLTAEAKTGPVWTGEVRTAPAATLNQPLRWRAPRRVFVNSMSDLFHPAVGFGTVTRVLHVMAHCPHHTFQVLTKRPDRMLAFVRQWADLAGEPDEPLLVRGPAATRAAHPSGRGQLFAAMLEDMGEPPPGCAAMTFDWQDGIRWWEDAFPNVWLGTSAEDQVRLDERGSAMAAIHALGWRTWCSAEPLLGPLDLRGHSWVEWLVAGGESGPRARPPHLAWFRQLRNQCAAAGVPYFFKQWGEYEDCGPAWGIGAGSAADLDGCVFVDGDGFDSRQRVMSRPDARAMRRVGKRRAGNHLDGVQHQAWPV